MQTVPEEIMQSIYDKIKSADPLHAAMFLKNRKRYQMSAELFLSLPGVKKTDEILDYGCGFPFVVKIISEAGYQITGYEPYATDNEKRMAKLLGVENIYLNVLPENKIYDHILMIDVIEHLAVISPFMEKIYSMLKPGGILFISSPNVMRFDMWKKFVFRKTGHPTSLMKYLKATDHYHNHQREFTMDELITTLKYFKFNDIILKTIRDTQPTIAELNTYHQLLNDGQKFSSSLTSKIINGILKLFPASVRNNNLFVAGRRGEVLAGEDTSQ